MEAASSFIHISYSWTREKGLACQLLPYLTHNTYCYCQSISFSYTYIHTYMHTPTYITLTIIMRTLQSTEECSIIRKNIAYFLQFRTNQPDKSHLRYSVPSLQAGGASGAATLFRIKVSTEMGFLLRPPGWGRSCSSASTKSPCQDVNSVRIISS